MESAVEKSKKDIKPGKVIRVDPVIWKFITHNRKPKETVSAVIRRLFLLPPRKGQAPQIQTFYILPESRIVCASIEEARGEAILRAIKSGKKKQIEKPIAVRAV